MVLGFTQQESWHQHWLKQLLFYRSVLILCICTFISVSLKNCCGCPRLKGNREKKECYPFPNFLSCSQCSLNCLQITLEGSLKLNTKLPEELNMSWKQKLIMELILSTIKFYGVKIKINQKITSLPFNMLTLISLSSDLHKLTLHANSQVFAMYDAVSLIIWTEIALSML